MTAWLAALVLILSPARAGAQQNLTGHTPRIGVLGLHGGVLPLLERAAEGLPIEVHGLDANLAEERTPDLANDDLLLVQHLRQGQASVFASWCRQARLVQPELTVLDISGRLDATLPELAAAGVIWTDTEATTYYRAAGEENLRGLLLHLLATRFGWQGQVPPPIPPDEAVLYHPEHDGPFADAQTFRLWAAGRHGDATEDSERPLAVVTAHRIHRLEQQPRLVAALVAALEEQGLDAVVLEDNGAAAAQTLADLAPDVVVHTCHSFDDLPARLALDVPQLHSLFFRRQSIEQWQQDPTGLTAADVSFQIASQELLGAIEPQLGAGTVHGGNSPEDLTPLPERVEHLARRAASWVRLRQLPNARKKIALIYYNREMGKSDLMRGSATGMFLNAPRSMVSLLQALDDAGYALPDRPRDEDELIELLLDHGRQIGTWDPAGLDALARSGQAVLLPVETYTRWLDQALTAALRADLERRWGPPPGRLGVWHDDQGMAYLVLPRVDLGGGVMLLPQPLRGEAYDTSLVHDRRVPPSHNYLATYLWLEHGFDADALVHFGTHGTEFLLPGRSAGLGPDDWTDVIMGTMPNITLWAMHNLGESTPARRRAYAVLVDHLVPPSVKTGLPDALANLQRDIQRLSTLEDGPLAQGFREQISESVRATGLDDDLGFSLPPEAQLTAEQLEDLKGYLDELAEQTTPIRLHHLGQAPRPEERTPWVTLCLGAALPDALDPWIDKAGRWRRPPANSDRHTAEVGQSTPDGDRRALLARVAEDLVDATLRQDLPPSRSLALVTGFDPDLEPPEELAAALDTARQIDDGLAHTDDEISNLLAALSGRFVPPGPGNSPDRNPAAVPTGRNMYTLDPRSVPSRPSWDLGRELMDELLSRRLAEQGHYPERIGFDLSSFATFRDYGVMESQILWALGVEPVWDARHLVHDLRLVPATELGRPRIDVIIASGPYYRDFLPDRMRLLDRAVRLVADLDEAGNRVFSHSEATRQELLATGMGGERAAILGRARLFGYPPGQLGSASYYYLVEKSGEWDDAHELARIYTEHSSHVYTEGLWGEAAPQAYKAALQGTEVVLRTWSDRTLSPLSNKYMWYRGGSLCLAVAEWTGRQPDFILSDVRDPSRSGLLSAEEALTRDFRVRLLNSTWARGMMTEGYAGADQVAKAVSNIMGWSIMRPHSVSPRQFEAIVDSWVRDDWHLGVRDWFEGQNPHAFQELTEILLESVRKGYWDASDEDRLLLASEFAESVARHGEGGGLLGGGNEGLERFVEAILEDEASERSLAALAAWRERREEAATPPPVAAPAGANAPGAAPSPDLSDSAATHSPAPEATASGSSPTETVSGRRLSPSGERPAAAPAPDVLQTWGLWAALAALALMVYGFLRGQRGRS